MKFKNIALIIFSLLTTLILAEVVLKLLTPTLINSSLTNQIYDDKLGYKMNQSLIGIDENGFRNPKSIKQAEIVVLGDSHTYGHNVNSEDSWPNQLANMANMTVYNFGMVGYGSLQYYYLIDEAIKLKPKHIIIGLYLANDLNDVCKFVNKTDYWQKWVKELGYNVEICLQSSNRPNRFEQFLSQQHLVSLTESVYKKIYRSLDLGDAVNVKEKRNPTLIKYNRIVDHKNNMDMERESISIGFEITKDVLKDTKRKADLNGIEFGVVFIPSKERVFYDYLTEKGYQLSTDYNDLIDNETTLVAKFSCFFNELGIKFVEAKPYVLRELYSSKGVYRPTDDGHPLEIGYKAYGKAAFDHIITESKNTDGYNCNGLPPEGKALTRDKLRN